MLNRLLSRHDERGFTMIEVLVVVGIIGVLTAIAVPVWLHQRQAGWEAAVRSTVSNASSYVMDNQSTLKGFHSYTQSPSTPTAAGIPGFISGESVELIVYGSDRLGKPASCIEGYNQMNNPGKPTNMNSAAGETYHNSRWHVTVSNAINVPMPYKVKYNNGVRQVTADKEQLGQLLPGECTIGLDVL